MSRVLLFAQDPGGAAVLAAIAGRLVPSDPTVMVVAHPLAEPAFARAGVSARPLTDWFDTLPVDEDAWLVWLGDRGVTHVVCSLSSRYRDLTNCHLVTASRRRGVPTLGFLDAWVGFDRFVDDHGEPRFLPDVAGCIDEYCRGRLVALGMDEAVVRAVGHPALPARSTPVRRGPGETLRVLLVSQPRARDRSFISIFETMAGSARLLDRLVAGCDGMDPQRPRLGFRAHPKESAPVSIPSTMERMPAVSDLPLYQDHDVLIGLTSMVLVEAALAGRVVVRLRVPELEDAIDEVDPPFPLGLEVRRLSELDAVLRTAAAHVRAGEAPADQQLPDLRESLGRAEAWAREFIGERGGV